ncbi:MAG: helix-turn-helix transcriptional regulator [Geobacteraceae bacterium]|nr:helix-turn-helix transcriptional regulator [Geobacteraceae bacterium]
MTEVLPENSFANRIERLIKLVGSKEKLGQLSKISAVMIGKYESGQSEPSRDKLISLANAAGVNVLWLATGEGPMKRKEAGEVDDKGSPPPLDDDLLATALKMVETMSKDLSIDQDKKASLVSSAYKEFYKVKYDGKEDD